MKTLKDSKDNPFVGSTTVEILDSGLIKIVQAYGEGVVLLTKEQLIEVTQHVNKSKGENK